jgi:hypothetical protein
MPNALPPMEPNEITGLLRVLGFEKVDFSWDDLEFRNPAIGLTVSRNDLRDRMRSVAEVVRFIHREGIREGMNRVSRPILAALGLGSSRGLDDPVFVANEMRDMCVQVRAVLVTVRGETSVTDEFKARVLDRKIAALSDLIERAGGPRL